MPIDLIRKYSSLRHWPTWIGLGLLRVLSILPLPILAVMGYLLGTITYLLHWSRRRIAFKNISACFPELSAWRRHWINYQHFCYMGQSILTACRNWWINEKRFDASVEIVGKEHYDKALAQGQRIILLSPHFMAMEVSGLALQREGPMVGMYQYMKNPVLDEMALRGRKRFCPDGVMFERKGPLRQLLRILMKGYPFSYSPDQDAMRKGVFVPFFHPLASTTPALAKFILTTGSIVIPCSNRMKPWGLGYQVVLGPPIEGLASGDEIADTTAMNRAIENMVRQMPDQYLWVHKRFKTRPPGEPKFYA